MTSYYMTINGFHVQNETWDDPLQWDGKGDEVYIKSVAKKFKKDGTLVTASSLVNSGGATPTSTSATMGDTNNQPGRIKAGSRSGSGGLQTNDSFPPVNPTRAPDQFELANPPYPPYPPYKIWGDDIGNDEVVYITPSIWEYDGGGSVVDSYIAWQAQTDAKFGERAKKIYQSAGGPMDWIFDAVSLGIQTVDSTSGIFGFRGKKGDRPIGTTRDPADQDKAIYIPQIIELTPAKAEALLNADPSGFGKGVQEISFIDDNYLAGHYLLYVQLHRGESSQPQIHSLPTDGVLKRGEKLISPNGRFTLWMQADGNLVLYDGVPSAATAYWNTNTWGRPPGQIPIRANMQTDGHLVLYDQGNQPVWGSGVWGNYINPHLEMQDDGNLVIYHNGWQPIWASHTVRRFPYP